MFDWNEIQRIINTYSSRTMSKYIFENGFSGEDAVLRKIWTWSEKSSESCTICVTLEDGQYFHMEDIEELTRIIKTQYPDVSRLKEYTLNLIQFEGDVCTVSGILLTFNLIWLRDGCVGWMCYLWVFFDYFILFYF